MSDTTREDAGDETAVSDSGGTMQRLSGTAVPRDVDLSLLEVLRRSESEGPWRPAGEGPFRAAGAVVQWRYGRRCDPMRVVRDDERGLVAWLAPGTELLSSAPDDGLALRDRPLAERFLGVRVPTLGHWQGGGILRIAPTGRPWSVWVFRDGDGSLAGHYVNLELPHRRSGDETNTRDLVLDLWLEADGALWLKDADELEAAVDAGQMSAVVADEVRAVAEWARAELVEAGGWPLDDEWTTWDPPADWSVPALPDTGDVRAARSRTLPS